MGFNRSTRQRLRRSNAARRKAENAVRKAKECSRREARIIERIKTTAPPYAPEVVSWMSAKLGKKAGQITEQDIAALTA